VDGIFYSSESANISAMPFTFSPPNQLTFLRILLTPVFIAFFLSDDPTLRQVSLPVFIVALLTDWYDGYVARRWGYVTRWGTFLDPLADKVVTSSALIAFVYLDLVAAWTVWAIVIRDILITFLRSYSEFKGRIFDTSRFAKTKTFLQFIVIFYIMVLSITKELEFVKLHYTHQIEMLLAPSLIDPLMSIVAVITVSTGVMYLKQNWKTVRELYDFSDRITESR
jgi:CDP-diacylglycerol--glycerol-3-phosphate 3-phosphatidyltransferase